MYCVNCGAKLTEGSLFCGNCGYKTNPPTVAVTAPEPKPEITAPTPVQILPSNSTSTYSAYNTTEKVVQVNTPPITEVVQQTTQQNQVPSPVFQNPLENSNQPMVVQLILASRRRRFVAAWVDGLIFVVFNGFANFFITSTFSENAAALGQVILFFGQYLYFYIMELEYGQTLGKMLLGIKVVKEDGSNLDSTTIFTRNISRLLMIIDILPILGASKRTFHDRWSKTRVIRV